MDKRLLAGGACKNYEADLVLYYYDDTDPADRHRIEDHLAICTGCRRFVDELRGLLPQLVNHRDMPETFWQNYYRETIAKLGEREARRQRWRDLFAPMQTWFAPAFGMAAMAVLAVGLIFANGSSPFWPDKSAAKLPEEIIADGNQLEFFSSLDMLESLSKLEEEKGSKAEPTAERSSHSRFRREAA